MSSTVAADDEKNKEFISFTDDIGVGMKIAFITMENYMNLGVVRAGFPAT